ncbi:putative GPI anchored protein [Aspergillus undulatus]|uniref:putative GPI anchored protein n=1 Tax=Aspergillus undulatus TaxID=1810928 RepID=UPI003CCD5EF7
MLFTPLLLGVASLAATVSALDQGNGRPQPKKPIGIRKMTGDEGEKFFMHYWQYEEDTIAANSTTADEDRTYLPRSYNFHPPFALGLERLADLRSSPLARREFECPTGTSACSSINRPDSCCGTDETCVVVEDTGSGDVGCCPAGQDCSGTIGSCWEGYTSCPSSLGGGCCFPGYECVEDGCSHVVTVTLTLSSTTLTTTSTETNPATSTSTSTAETTTTTSSSSSTSSTTDLSPPDRPTSASTTTSSETETSCPTGFYACAAVYQGGCCQTGRDCDTTSCPAMSSSTVVSDGRTIVVAEPTDAPSADEGSDEGSDESGAKRCATGWFSCADTVGGGCCPTGYACGSSCTAVPTASTTGTVAKEEPTVESGGDATRSNWKTMVCVTFMAWMML